MSCRKRAAALNILREQLQPRSRVLALPGSVSGGKIRSLLWRRIGALTALILAYRREVILYPWLEEAVSCIGAEIGAAHADTTGCTMPAVDPPPGR